MELPDIVKETFNKIKKDKKLKLFAAGFFVFESIGIYSQLKAIQELSIKYQTTAVISGGLAKVCLGLFGGEILYDIVKEKVNDKIIYSKFAMKIGPYIPLI